jgi:long-chain acyl-CoA synthetase
MKPKRIFDILVNQVEQNPIEKCLSMKKNGIWEATSTQEFLNKANQITSAFIELGVKTQDKIALITSANRTEWSIFDMGILQFGGVTVPLYPTISSADYEYILNHSESAYCVVSDEEIYNKVFSIKNKVKGLKDIYSFERIDGCKNWSELLSLGKKKLNKKKLEKVKSNVSPEDLATIIYTSGTTGIPKGVMLNHHNIVSNVLSSSIKIPLNIDNSCTLSFLPVCHIFERTFLYLYIHNSLEVYFAESLESIPENLKEIKPHFITAVPRLLEKIYDKFYEKGNSLKGYKKIIFKWAIKIAEQYDPDSKNGNWYKLKLNLVQKLVLNKWKDALGGDIKLIASGSAPLQTRLIRLFTAAKMPIVEGYGLTETSPVLTFNDIRNNELKIGTVGKPIQGVEIKIAEDGEILCKGPNIMKGYFKDPELTENAMSGEFFHTGDIGIIDDDGFLKITDRKKQIFKTSGGKYIAPQVIENQLKQSILIDQVMVVGEGQKMPAALIQPNFYQARLWFKKNAITFENSMTGICENKSLIEEITREIKTHDKNFGSWESVKAIRLTPEIWSIEEGHLTPTMKVKRKVVINKYQSLIKEIYE